MRMIGFRGVRGGVGTTSVVAMVAQALHQSGQRVLMVDLNPSDMLRLHFNVRFEETAGWASAGINGQAWNEQAFQIDDGLTLLPFGRFGCPQAHDPALDDTSLMGAVTDLQWLDELTRLRKQPDWILLDVAHDWPASGVLNTLTDLQVLIASVDAGCHIRLCQHRFRKGWRLLANMQDPSRDLCNDLLTDWTGRFHEMLLPVVISRDESIHEALAMKTCVGRAFPQSSGSGDAKALATWLQLHVRERR